MSELIIETNGLTRRYGRQVSVNNLNLSVRKGEIYGFLGPNGAGKTTTIRMLLGLIRPTSGEVRVFGRELSRQRTEILRRVGSLVESPSYYGHLSGYENLNVLAKLLGVNDKRIREVLDIVRLTEAGSKPVKGYSLGMKQRLGIAAALLGEPELLILDEPTNGLDPAGIQEMRELIIEMPRRFGLTVVVSSHLLAEIDQMATQVGIINQGNLIYQDSIHELRKRSASRLLVETNSPQEAHDLLGRDGFSPVFEGNALAFEGIDDAQAAAINRRLVLAGHDVYRLREVKTSLEDIFLEMVGKGASL